MRQMNTLKDLFSRMHYLWKRSVYLKKPRLFLRILMTTLIFLLTRRDVLWLASISITSKCNLNCKHCFSKRFLEYGLKSGKHSLSTDEIVGVIEDLAAEGVFAFDFQGGEVFLHPDLERIIKACKPERSFIGIITNGVLFTDEAAGKLKEWGVDQIAISIDSGVREEHDAFRNQSGVWDSAFQAVEIAARNGFRVIVDTTVTHQSIYTEGFKKLNEFCVQNDLVQLVFLGIPVGNWAGRTDVLIDQADHEYLAELDRKSNGLIRRDLHPRMFRSGCPAVKESLHITDCGEVLPCPFIHISLGNLVKHTLHSIRERALTLPKFRDASNICLIGQDRDFIEKFGVATFTSEDGPLDGEKVFEFTEKLPPRETPLEKF
jgi:MoaA/NifB/PqqE/SkfB family radical SAM enzyme